jgi:hypothetical protein
MDVENFRVIQVVDARQIYLNQETVARCYELLPVDRPMVPKWIRDQLHINRYVIGQINLLKPPGYRMRQQVECFNNCTLCPYCIYVFCICLRTKIDLCHLHKKLIGFYNRDAKCLHRGTGWIFK